MNCDMYLYAQGGIHLLIKVVNHKCEQKYGLILKMASCLKWAKHKRVPTV